MRRTVLALAALAFAGCAGRAKPPPVDPRAPAGPVVVVPPGFEAVPGEVLTEYDLTHDGKPDVWKYVSRGADGKEVLLRKEKDLNADGRIDVWEKYAADGTPVRLVYDLDFDGKPDETLFYEKDQLVKKELALGFDGVPRTWNYYEKGKLVRKERDTNGDSTVDTWEYWENGEIDRIGVDEDADGQVDRWDARKSAAPAGDGRSPPPSGQK
jgi:hypothetical protein